MSEVRCWKKAFESDLPNIVSEFKETVARPSLIILSGVVGAGKTTFVKAFMGDAGGTELQSPTYSLVQEKANIVHADLYRLEDPEELVHLELELYLEGKDYFLVEWGKDYLNELRREVDEEFTFFELEIQQNISPDQKEQQSSRNYILRKIK